jgi:hypothetical protein
LPRAAPAVPAVVLRVSTADLVTFGIAIMEETYYAVDAVSSGRFRTGLVRSPRGHGSPPRNAQVAVARSCTGRTVAATTLEIRSRNLRE